MLQWWWLCLKWLLWLQGQGSEHPPCPHCPTAPTAKRHPGAKPDMKICCSKHCIIWYFFQLAPTFSCPASGGKACLLLVPPGGLMFPRHRPCPNSSGAGWWCHQQWNRDMIMFSTSLVPSLICPAVFTRGRWDGAKDSGDITLMPGQHPQHPTSFVWEHPALASKPRCRSSKATLMSIYPTCRDINNLKNTENRSSVWKCPKGGGQGKSASFQLPRALTGNVPSQLKGLEKYQFPKSFCKLCSGQEKALWNVLAEEVWVLFFYCSFSS